MMEAVRWWRRVPKFYSNNKKKPSLGSKPSGYACIQPNHALPSTHDLPPAKQSQRTDVCVVHLHPNLIDQPIDPLLALLLIELTHTQTPHTHSKLPLPSSYQGEEG